MSRIFRSLALLSLLWLTGCAEVPATNPYDPTTPADQQAGGRITGRIVVLEAGYDLARLSELTVTLRDLSLGGALGGADGADSENLTPDLEGDDAGNFVFDPVRPGSYLIRVSATGLEGDPLTVVVNPGSDIGLGDLILRPSAVGGERRGRLSGVVLRGGAGDEAHEGITVRVEGAPYITLTSSSGAFALEVPEGLHRVVAQATGYSPLSLGENRVTAGEETVLPDPFVLLANPSRVRGLVALDRFSTPAAVAAVQVSLTDAQGMTVAVEVVDGAFLLPGIAAGSYTAVAALEGYVSARRPLEVPVGATIDLGVLLLQHESGTEAAVVLRGTVRLQGADEHSGTTVRVRIGGRDVPFARVATDSVGDFEVFASRSETYQVDVEHGVYISQPDLGPYRYDVAADAFLDDAGRALDTTLTAEPFDGRVVVALNFAPDWVADDGFAETADVQVIGPNRVYNQAVRLDAPTTFANLSEGVHVVSVRRRGFLPSESVVVLSRGDPSQELAAVLVLDRLSDTGFAFADRTLTPGVLCDVELRGADLSGATLEGDFSQGRVCGAAMSPPYDFRGARLSEARLDGNFDRVDLSYTALLSADLEGSSFIDATFFASNLSNASLRGSTLSRPPSPAPAQPAQSCGPDEGRRDVDGQRIDLRNAVLAGADLTNANLGGLDLRRTEFGGTLLVGTLLSQTCLRDVRLTLTDLSGADLDQADAQRLNLANSVLQDTTLRGADLRGATLLSTVLERADFSCKTTEVTEVLTRLCACNEPMDGLDDGEPAQRCRTRMGGVALNGANAVGVDFSGADLTGAALLGVSIGDALGDALGDDALCGPGCPRQTRLVETRLDDAELAGVELGHVDLTRATLRGANLSDARLSADSTYTDVVLTGANLTRASLVGLDLRSVDLQRTTLHFTNLSSTNLRNVAFDGASFRGVVFDRALIRGASFSGAVFEDTLEIGPSLVTWDPARSGGVATGGFDFSGAHFIRGDLGWMVGEKGLNLDGARFGLASRVDVLENGLERCIYEADVHGSRDIPTIKVADPEIIGATLRGATGGPYPADIGADGFCPLPLAEMSHDAGLTAGGVPPKDISFAHCDLSNAHISARVLDVSNSDLTSARVELCGPLTKLRALRSDLSGITVIAPRIRGESALLDIVLSDLSDASVSGVEIGGLIERTSIRGMDFAAPIPGVLVPGEPSRSTWADIEFRMVDFEGATPPLVMQLRLLDDKPGRKFSPMFVDSSFPAGTVIDISNWKGVEVIRTDLRGVRLVATRTPENTPDGSADGLGTGVGEGVSAELTALSRHLSIVASPIRGLTVSTVAGAGPTILDLEMLDLRNVPAGTFDLGHEYDLLTSFRVRGMDEDVESPAVTELPATKQIGVAGPRLPELASGSDIQTYATYERLLRGGVSGDDKKDYPDIPGWRSGAYLSLGGSLDSPEALTKGRSEGTSLTESEFVGPGQIEIGGLRPPAPGSEGAHETFTRLEVAGRRAGITFAASTFRGVTIEVGRTYVYTRPVDEPSPVPEGSAEDNIEGWLPYGLDGLNFSASTFAGDVVVRTALKNATFARSLFAPGTTIGTCTRCSARGIEGVADVDIGGLRALIEGASETDFAETNLSLRRDGDDSQMTTPGGSSFAGGSLRGRGLSGELVSPQNDIDTFTPHKPTAFWHTNLTEVKLVDGRGFLLAGASGTGVKLIGAFAGAVIGRTDFPLLNAVGFDASGALTWDSFSAPGATFEKGEAPNITRFSRREPIAGPDPNANPTPPGLGVSSLRRANLQGVTLIGDASFEGVDLRCANLSGLRIAESPGHPADPPTPLEISFRNANLMFADLRGADLRRATFQGANLRYARIDRDTLLPNAAAAYDEADVSFIIVDDAALADSGEDRLRAAGQPVSRFDRPVRVPIPNCAQSF